MGESVELEGLPCDPIYMPVEAPLKPMETVKLTVPVQIHGHAIATDKVYDFTLTFRGPNGNSFGEPIPLKMKVNVGVDQTIFQAEEQPVENMKVEMDEISQYKMAIKLLDNLKLGKDLNDVM